MKAHATRRRNAALRARGKGRSVKRKSNSFFGPSAVASAKRVKKIRRVQERNTKEGGEIVSVQPGGWLKVKWDNRQRPTLIKRSEIKRYPYVRNPAKRKTVKMYEYAIETRTRGYTQGGPIKAGSAIIAKRKIKREYKAEGIINLKVTRAQWAENPGLVDLVGGMQALDYLAGKAGIGRKRNPNVAPYTLQTDAGQRVAGEWWTKAAALKVAQQYANETGKLFWIYKTNKAGSMLPVRRVFPRIKHNPSVKDMSERFQGSANGDSEEFYFSDKAPRLDFSRGGKLVFLKLKGTTIRVPQSVVAIDPVTEKLWLGCKNSAGMFKRKAASGEQLDYGPVDAICYLTKKKHIGNGKTYEYVHSFAEEGGKKPTLLIDSDGMPILRGGSYRIEDRGIVN